MEKRQESFDIVKYLTEKNKRSYIDVCEKAMLKYYTCVKNNAIVCDTFMTNNKLFNTKCTKNSSR